MAEIANFYPLQSGANETGSNQDDRKAEIKAKLNLQGSQMVQAVVRGASRMEAAGVIRDTRTASDRETGRRKYAAATSDYVGGWREFPHKGTTRLIRLSASYPTPDAEGKLPSLDGFAEVEIAEPRPVGTTKMAGNVSQIRVTLDDKGTHVSGMSGALKFNVDHPNPATMEADFTTAQGLFETAAVGLMALEATMPPEQPALPAAPTA